MFTGRGSQPEYWQPLHFLCQGSSKTGKASQLGVLRRLIDMRADIEGRNGSLQTPLLQATGQNQIGVAQVLIRAGANKFVKGANGKTLQDLAQMKAEWYDLVWDVYRGSQPESQDYDCGDAAGMREVFWLVPVSLVLQRIARLVYWSSCC